MSVYQLAALGVGASHIDALQSFAIDPAITELLQGGDSSIDIEHVSVASQIPLIRGTTTNIKAALTIMGVAGIAIDEAGSSNGIVLYFAKRATPSGIASGNVHMKAAINLGSLYPVTLRGTHQQAAELDFVVVCAYDDTNEPVPFTKDQALVDLSPAVHAVHTCGPWYVNGELTDQIQEFNVNFGLDHEVEWGSGQVWPRQSYIKSRQAFMTCVTRDTDILDKTTGVGIGGVARSGVTRGFLRKKAEGARLVADNVAEHIRFDMAKGLIRPDADISARHQEQVSVGLRATPAHDQVNDPLAYTADVVVSGA